MIDFEDYAPKLDRTFTYRTFTTLVNVTLPSGKTVVVEDRDDEAFKKYREECRKEDLEIAERFKNDCFKEWGIENHPKRELFYDKIYTLSDKDKLEILNNGNELVCLLS